MPANDSAVMISLDEMQDESVPLYGARSEIQDLLLKELENTKSYDVIVGRPNTSAAVKERIALVRKLFKKAIQ